MENIGSIYRGWFIAPKTTTYRFYAACDDRCSLSIATTADSTAEDDMVLIIDDLYMEWGARRNYHYDEKQISDWVSLTEGEAYYIEGTHFDLYYWNHFTVGVEIAQSDFVGHHHSKREVQMVTMQPETIFEAIRLTITNMDDGYFKLVFLNEANSFYTTSYDCSSMATASNLKSCIQSYYHDSCGGNPTVNGTFYDADGLEVEDPVEGGSGEYYIHAGALLDGICSTSITVVKTTSTSTISVDLAKDVQLSSPPLGGHFKIQCTDSEGYVSETPEIATT